MNGDRWLRIGFSSHPHPPHRRTWHRGNSAGGKGSKGSFSRIVAEMRPVVKHFGRRSVGSGPPTPKTPPIPARRGGRGCQSGRRCRKHLDRRRSHRSRISRFGGGQEKSRVHARHPAKNHRKARSRRKCQSLEAGITTPGGPHTRARRRVSPPPVLQCQSLEAGIDAPEAPNIRVQALVFQPGGRSHGPWAIGPMIRKLRKISA